MLPTLVVNIIDTVGLSTKRWAWSMAGISGTGTCSNAVDVLIENEVHLVGGLEQFLFFHILGIIIQLTIIFQRG